MELKNSRKDALKTKTFVRGFTQFCCVNVHVYKTDNTFLVSKMLPSSLKEKL